MSMNERVRRIWADALRSGEYEQGSAYLMKGEEGSDKKYFCCLGVLCDLYAKEHNVSIVDVITWPTGLHEEKFDHGAYLPNEVMEWAGLDSINPRLEIKTPGPGDSIFSDSPQSVRGIASLNDSGNYDFPTLADLIDKQL